MILVHKNVATDLFVTWTHRTPTGTLSYVIYLRQSLKDQIDDAHPGGHHFHFLVSADVSPSKLRYNRFNGVVMNIPVGTYKYVVYALNVTNNSFNQNTVIGIVDSGMLTIYEHNDLNQYFTPDITTTFFVEQSIGE